MNNYLKLHCINALPFDLQDQIVHNVWHYISAVINIKLIILLLTSYTFVPFNVTESHFTLSDKLLYPGEFNSQRFEL